MPDEPESVENPEASPTEEQELVVTLELANRTMSGMQWLRWILVEGRQFEDRQAVIRRLDEL